MDRKNTLNLLKAQQQSLHKFAMGCAAESGLIEVIAPLWNKHFRSKRLHASVLSPLTPELISLFETAVHAAAEHDQVEFITELRMFVKKVDCSGWDFEIGNLASNGEIVCLKALLQAGVNVHLEGRLCDTALLHAVTASQVQCVKALLDFGAGAMVADTRRETPLQIESANGQVEIVELLLKSVAGSNKSTDHWRRCLFGLFVMPQRKATFSVWKL